MTTFSRIDIELDITDSVRLAESAMKELRIKIQHATGRLITLESYADALKKEIDEYTQLDEPKSLSSLERPVRKAMKIRSFVNSNLLETSGHNTAALMRLTGFRALIVHELEK